MALGLHKKVPSGIDIILVDEWIRRFW